MRAIMDILIIMFISIPVFACFLLFHRLEHNKVDKEAGKKFYEALRQQYGLAEPEPEPKRALTEEERIALARRISEDPFADVRAEDVMEELPAEEKEQSEVHAENNQSQEAPADSGKSVPKMSREDAVAAVSAILGSSSNKKKGSALSELQDTLAKYRKQIDEQQNNAK